MRRDRVPDGDVDAHRGEDEFIPGEATFGVIASQPFCAEALTWNAFRDVLAELENDQVIDRDGKNRIRARMAHAK